MGQGGGGGGRGREREGWGVGGGKGGSWESLLVRNCRLGRSLISPKKTWTVYFGRYRAVTWR